MTSLPSIAARRRELRGRIHRSREALFQDVGELRGAAGLALLGWGAGFALARRPWLGWVAGAAALLARHLARRTS